jgi:ribose 5-phosphate isomerase B
MATNTAVTVYVGADHAGFALKKAVIAHCESKGMTVVDCGAFILDKNDDYPAFCFAVATQVAHHHTSMGVVIGGSGIGEAIAANKVRGIRAAVVYDAFTARKSREHNDANIIALRNRGVSAKKSLQLLDIWLKTPFSNADRHKRRILQIAAFERSL